MLDVVQTLCDLVAIPSVNPMGSGRTGPEFFEGRVTDYLQGLFTRLGWAWRRQGVEPGRDNIFARLDGDTPPERGGPLVMLEAHQDTVPVDGMTIAPWTPIVADGRITGRGSCDIKGGMAAMLTALSRLADERPAGRPTVVMACTINEEHGYTGALTLRDSWREPTEFFPRRPDAAIVAEPTELNVVVAHKGCVRWRCHATGRAAHSSRPELGDNAIYKISRALPTFERYQKEVAPHLAEHPLCGRPSLSVGTIHGGLSVNTVPDDCVIEIDRRVIPGEDPTAARQLVLEFLAKECPVAADLRHEAPFMSAIGLPDRDNGPLAERLLAAAGRVVDGRKRVGVPFGTDAATFQAASVPSVVFGPGSIAQAHTADEWIAIEQLHRAAEIYYEALRMWSA